MSHQHPPPANESETDVDCPMIMTFHFSNCETILFKSWTASTPAGFAISTAIIFLFAIIYEGLKYLREKMYMRCVRPDCANKGVSSSILQQNDANRRTVRQYIFDKNHFIQTLMHIIQVFLSYCLMLIVMTFNLWLFLAVVLGATVGHFCFGWLRQRSYDMDHCH